MLVLAPVVACAAAAGSSVAGRPLCEVLEQIGSSTLRLIYNSSIVPCELKVEREADASDPLERLQQLLAPFDLQARRVSGNVYAIVRAPRDVTRPRPVAPAAAPAPSQAPLEQIVVAAGRFRIADDIVDSQLYFTQTQLESLPRLAEDSLKVLHRLPGAASNGVSGLAHLRGGEEDETLIVLDGLSLYEPFHLKNFLGPTSVLDPRMLGSLDVHAGGFTAEFGDRMSAIVEARSVHPEEQRRYEVGLSLFHASALAAQRFAGERGDWLVSFRRSNLDEIADLGQSAIGEPAYMDAFARLDYALTDSTRASLHLLLARDKVEISDEEDHETAEASYHNAYLWATLEHDWSAGVRGSIIGSFTDIENLREGEVADLGSRVGTVDDRRHHDIAGLKADAVVERERWLLRAGAELRSLSAEYDYRSEAVFAQGYPLPGSPGFTRSTELSPEPSGGQYSAYLSGRGRIGRRWTAELGLRWDRQTYVAQDGDDQLAPRLSLLYSLDDATRLRASWGRFQQFQGINELQVEDGVDQFYAAQYADQAILAFERDWSPGTTLRIEAYRKDYGRPRARYENLFDPLSLLPELEIDRVRIAPTSSFAEGLELMFAWRGAQGWSGWASYAWSQALDRVEGESVPRSWDQTHGVGLGLQWAQGPWDATAAVAYHTGWPTTRVSLRDDAGSAASAPVDIGARNAARLEHYATLDLHVGRLYALRHGVLSVFAEISNTLDRRNPCCVDYSLEAIDGRWVLDQEFKHWLPLVPSIGARWIF